MKTKTTKKFLQECYRTINIGNGELQALLTFKDAQYYCQRTEGWACDAYIIGDYALIDGYDCVGKVVSFELRQKYESKAREILSKFHNGSKYWTEKRVINTFDTMIKDFIQEAC